MIELGSEAPNFILMDTDKNKVSLSSYVGKKTVLAFLPGAFTGVCTKEACTLRDSAAELNQLDAHVLAITVDSIFANNAFREQHNLNFPLLSDYNREVINKYGVVFKGLGGMEEYISAQRSVFVLDPKGKVMYKWIADAPGIEPNYDEVKEALAKI